MKLVSRLLQQGSKISIRSSTSHTQTAVDAYWSGHTVNSRPFESASDSEAYLRWRNEQYPMFPELMDMWGHHADETILDYGCGPGNDLVGFLLYSGASKVIGIDVSSKALALARDRVGLHRFPAGNVELILTGDADVTIPLEPRSIDYINCSGVIHHTSHPAAILAEFSRVLKPGGRGRIMAYNRQSLWFHLYVAYLRMVLEGAFSGLSVEQAFGRSTDGEDCPISIPYRSDDFLKMLSDSGLQGRFLGGYLSRFELDCWARQGARAIEDPRLGAEHRSFLRELAFDGLLPTWCGLYAGIGGVYEFTPQ